MFDDKPATAAGCMEEKVKVAVGQQQICSGKDGQPMPAFIHNCGEPFWNFSAARWRALAMALSCPGKPALYPV